MSSRRVTAREQGDLMALADQLFRQPVPYALRAAVGAGRNGFRQICAMRIVLRSRNPFSSALPACLALTSVSVSGRRSA